MYSRFLNDVGFGFNGVPIHLEPTHTAWKSGAALVVGATVVVSRGLELPASTGSRTRLQAASKPRNQVHSCRNGADRPSGSGQLMLPYQCHRSSRSRKFAIAIWSSVRAHAVQGPRLLSTESIECMRRRMDSVSSSRNWTRRHVWQHPWGLGCTRRVLHRCESKELHVVNMGEICWNGLWAPSSYGVWARPGLRTEYSGH